MRLRPYQFDAIDAIYDYFSKNSGDPIVALPTGTGKSLTIAAFIARAHHEWTPHRTTMITHVQELIEQNAKTLKRLWPGAPLAIYSAGLGRSEIGPITYAGIASVHTKAHLFGRQDVLLIDECHLVSPKATTMYQRFIKDLREINPRMKVVGFSATPWRLGVGHLTDGGLFTDVCYDRTTLEGFNYFIDEGYLTQLIPRQTAVQIDVSAVPVKAGEYVLKDLQSAVDKESITRAALTEAVTYSGERRKWLVFTTGVEHTDHVAAMLRDEFDIEAAAIHSKMTKEARAAALEGFKNGTIQALVNNNVLTTGFDAPDIDMIIVLRHTQSPSLWVQMLGRGVRPVYAEGQDLTTQEGRLAAIATGPKPDCLVLDFAANTARLGPINDPVMPRKKGARAGGAPVKTCDKCGCYNHASVRACSNCGEVFDQIVRFSEQAATDELIRRAAEFVEPIIETLAVDRITYAVHKKPGRPDTLRVTYYCGYSMFQEWICIEHPGYPGRLARQWWRQRTSKDAEPPAFVADAMPQLEGLKRPTHIRVQINKKPQEIKGYEFPHYTTLA